jgi:hypothetical protein
VFSGQPAGVERVSRVLQLMLNRFCERMRATKYASHGLRRLLECIHGLAEIVVCGGGVDVATTVRVVAEASITAVSSLTIHTVRGGFVVDWLGAGGARRQNTHFTTWLTTP